MRSFLFAVEAVNFAAVGDDTTDLSTIRGSGLMLLEAIVALDDRVAPGSLRSRLQAIDAKAGIETLSTGASAGVWRIVTERQSVSQLIREVDDALRQGGAFVDDEQLSMAIRHATFVVTAIAETETSDDDGGLQADRERLMAAVRFAQMTGPTEIYPDLEAAHDGKHRVCQLDLKRPALKDSERIAGGDVYVSASVSERRIYGRDAKQMFYRRVLDQGGRIAWDKARQCTQDPHILLPKRLEPLEKKPFAWHFASLSTGNSGPLADKIAVLYIDGNKFSRLQQKAIKGEIGGLVDAPGETTRQLAMKRLRVFDTVMKSLWRDYLGRLLHLLATDKHGFGPPNPGEAGERANVKKPEGASYTVTEVARIETLLWGADEVCFVLPAHLGFAAVELLFGCVEGAAPEIPGIAAPGKPWTLGPTQRLGVSAGLVFCHHDAPIARIRRLADMLAVSVKDCNKERGLEPEDGNGVAAMVLESFDHVGSDVNGHLQRIWTRAGFTPLDAPLRPAAIAHLRHLKGVIKAADFARRQLRRLAAILHREGKAAFETAWPAALNTIADVDKRAAFDAEFQKPWPGPADPLERKLGHLGAARLAAGKAAFEIAWAAALNTTDDKEARQTFEKDFKPVWPFATEPEQRKLEGLDAARLAVLHLEEFWDYLDPPGEKGTAIKTGAVKEPA